MNAHPYKYTVDGEKVTMHEIVKRLPGVIPQTVRKRINAGLRTWAELGATPIQGNAAAVNESKSRMQRILAR